ncbi:High affinity cAMP-specific 3',5'-cyclic phosphodiesterase 7A [Dinochytrium kinnereticum]|nr:High affinity cAMP-specific 3',5'-cyclic phosphodiesterase 7A [Dinochytrium kinnereticum]
MSMQQRNLFWQRAPSYSQRTGRNIAGDRSAIFGSHDGVIGMQARLKKGPSSFNSSETNGVPLYAVAKLKRPGAGGDKDTADEISVISNTFKEKLKDLGNPLRGPIMIQMTLHYIYFLVVMISANQTNWGKYIRFYTGFVYGVIAVFTLQLSRICYASNPNSIIPFYLSIAPFAMLIVISRETHMIAMVLWFVSFLVIYLQSGGGDLKKHIKIYAVALICVYSACIGFMSWFYVPSCTRFWCGKGFENTDQIRVENESVLGAACVIIAFGFVMLERFIKMNASTLLERENYMNQLYIANIDLKKQLRRARNQEEIDLEAPLSKATQILKDVKEIDNLDSSIMSEIDMIVKILASDQLYNPNLYQKPADADLHDWLNDMLLPSAKRTPDPKDPTRANPTFAISSIPEPAVGAQKEVTFSPSIDIAITPTDSRVFALLEDVENPNFDVFTLEEATEGRVLYYIGWYLYRYHDVFEKYRIPEVKFRHWLAKVESGYKDSNPYHNAMHAADVTHSMHYYVTRKRLWGHLIGEEKIASLIAPIIHDYMHPGVNNAFLISTLSPLTVRYNDQSVLENFHCASIFELMQSEEYDILVNCQPETRRLIRESVISMVLATDMAMHFDWIGKFKNKLTGTGFNFESRQDRRLVLNIAIKCADVNNPTKPNESSRKWTELICEEFFAQGDEEKKKGLPISMFMNRESTDIPKSQMGFIDFIVNPLFDAWSGFMMEDLRTQLDNIAANKAFWKSCSEKAIAGSQVIAQANSSEKQ